MALKLISLEEASRIIGVGQEEVQRLRETGELHAYRDGGAFKFKLDEVQRVSEDRKSGGKDSGELLDSPLELGEDDDSVLLSEQELGNSPETKGSTIIGKEKKAGPPPMNHGGSDLKLALDGGSQASTGPSDSAAQFADDLGLDLGSDVHAAKPAKPAKPAAHAEMSDLKLADDKPAKAGKSDSSAKLAFDDEDLVLGGSGSDVTLGSGDSGIGLTSPSDSGLSLEEPLELTGSSEALMELGEDDVISLEEDADLESATQLKADDEFLLTPSADAFGEDSSDSGSQVIALEDEGAFGEQGMMGESGGLVEDMEMGGFGAGAMAGAMAYAPARPEAPYSIFNVLALFLCLVLTMLAAMMMFDLMRTMWSWDQPTSLNSSLMNGMLKWFGQ